MRAQAFLIPKLAWVLGAFVFLLVVGGIIFTFAGGLSSFSELFDDLFGPPDETNFDLAIAKASFAALTCATNSMLSESDLGCSLFNAKIGDSIVHTVEVDCNIGTVDSANEKCVIKNFWLPQEVSNAEDWIVNYGNPNFIIYWNMFPQEEDTWSGGVEWSHHLAFAAISLVPFGRVAGSSIRLTGIFLRGSGSKAAQQTAKNLLIKEFGEAEVVELGKKGTKELSKDFIKQEGRIFFAKEFARQRSKEIALQKLKDYGKLKLKGPIAKFATLELAAAALIDSTLEIYEPIGKSLAFSRPFEDLDIEPLAASGNKPVMVAWNPDDVPVLGFEDNIYKNLHFASPCLIREFSLVREDVKCEEYNIDYHTSNPKFICLDPTPTSDDLPICDEFDKNAVDPYFGEGSFSKMTSLLRVEKTLFEFKDGEFFRPGYGFPDKIYLPILSTGGRQIILSDLTYDLENSDTIPGISGGDEQIDAYEYNLIQNGITTGKSEIICKSFILNDIVFDFNDKNHVNRIENCIITDSILGTIKLDLGYEYELFTSLDDRLIRGNKIYTSQTYTGNSENINFVETISFSDSDFDDKFDTIEFKKSNNAFFSDNSASVIFTDIDSAGNYQFAGKKNCKIDAVLADLRDDLGLVDDYLDGDYENNYCLRHQSEGSKAIQVGTNIGIPIGQAILVIAGPFSAGATWALLAVGTAAITTVNVITDYKAQWPGPD